MPRDIIDINNLDPLDFRIWNQFLEEAAKNKTESFYDWEPFLTRYQDILNAGEWKPVTRLYSVEDLVSILKEYYIVQRSCTLIAADYGGIPPTIHATAKKSLRRLIKFIRLTELPNSYKPYKVYSEEKVKLEERTTMQKKFRYVLPWIDAKFSVDNVYAESKENAINLVHYYCPAVKVLKLQATIRSGSW